MAAMGMGKTVIFHFLQAAQIVRCLDLIQHTLIKCMLYPSQCFRYRKYHRDKTEDCKFMNLQWEKPDDKCSDQVKDILCPIKISDMGKIRKGIEIGKWRE